jgi:hypothetical protein
MGDANLNRYIEVDTVQLKELVDGDVYPVLVYAVGPSDTVNNRREFKVPVSFLGRQDSGSYRILLIANKRLLGEAPVERKEWGKEIEVSFPSIVFEPPEYRGMWPTFPTHMSRRYYTTNAGGNIDADCPWHLRGAASSLTADCGFHRADLRREN